MKYGCCLFHLLTPTSLVKHLPLVNDHNHWHKNKKNSNKWTWHIYCVEHRKMANQRGHNNERDGLLLPRYYHIHSEVGKMHRIPRLVTVYLRTRGSCESSQVRLLCMYMGVRKTLLTAVHHFDCPARLLRPKPPNTPTSPPGQMASFFFFNCLWALAPLL